MATRYASSTLTHLLCTTLLVVSLVQTGIVTKVYAASIPENVPLSEKHHHLISKLSHYELVRPYRSTSDGDFYTHDLSTIKEEERNVYLRAKRDTHQNGRSRHTRSTSHRIRGGDHHDDLQLNHHFRVDAFGTHLKLNVTRNRFLVSPKMRVERYNEDGTKDIYRPQTLCFYTGQVNGVKKSSVAISNCDGLSGFIQSGDEEYVIEPLESVVGRSKVNVSRGHLHIMYRPKDFKMEANDLQTAFSMTHDLRHDTPEEDTPNQGQESDNGDRQSEHGRKIRSAGDPGQKHHVETLLTADYSVTSFHGVDATDKYLLTMLNIVNMAYRHDSMTADIQFAASRIILLSEALSGNMVVERQAQASLSNVCQWSTRQTVRDDTQANHHDLSAFVTRLDFGPAGYAPVTGMCAMTRSCALSRDEGLLSSFVMAHEAGHVFGMEHDGAGNSCTEEPYRGSIMAPVVISTYTNHFWSDCSIQELQRYLRNYDCLEDDPFDNGLPELDGYPGEWYDMNDQCKFDFGEDFEQCGAPEDDNACSQLWCIDPWDPQYCRTKKGPPLDGSYCAPDKWCLQGVCGYKDVGRQNGEWSKFSSWSSCTYPCGVGVQVRKRECNNPPPTNGGKDCKGDSYEYRLCNKKACFGEYEDRRAKQCEDNLASFSMRGNTHTWLPHENRNETLQCRLTCISESTHDVVVADYNVIDGTPCSYDDHYSVCVQGNCVKLGCDNHIDSTKVEDKCGVCEGDNGQCIHIKRNFVQQPKTKYQVIHTLPAGSRNIDVRQNTNTESFIALRRPPEKVYILNARGTQAGPHSFIGVGSRFVYSPDEERLFSVGPIQADVDLLVYWKKTSKPINITYEYFLNSQREQPPIHTPEVEVPEVAGVPEVEAPEVEVPEVEVPEVEVPEVEVPVATQAPQPNPNQPEYIWQDEGWTACTKTCGGGFSFHRFQCYQTSDNSKVKKTFCGQGKYNPKKGKRACNQQSCEVIPQTDPVIQAKPVTTIPPTTKPPTTVPPVRTTQPQRTTAKPTPQQQPTTTAATTQKSTTTATTTKQPATITQQPTTTTQQSTTTKATTTKQSTTTTAATTQQPPTTSPIITQPPPTTTLATTVPPVPTTQKIKKPKKGKKKPFYSWKSEEWQPCSHTCGTSGIQTREVTCSKKLGKKKSTAPSYKCKKAKPATSQPCIQEPCPAFWSIGEWSSCTVTCGEGYKNRDVICAAAQGDPDEFQCYEDQPESTTTCNDGECPEETGCVPMESVICNKSMYRTYCNMPGYESICCTTCQEQENQSKKKKKRKRGRGGRGE